MGEVKVDPEIFRFIAKWIDTSLTKIETAEEEEKKKKSECIGDARSEEM